MHIIIQGESLYFAVYFFVFLRSQDLVVNLSRKKVDEEIRKFEKLWLISSLTSFHENCLQCISMQNAYQTTNMC